MVTQARPENQPENLSPFGRSGIEELNDLAARVETATQELQERPDDPAAALALENAELERRLFFVEHDNAGAFKSKKLGRRIQSLFEPGPDGKSAIAMGEDGELKLDASQSQRRVMMVNMGELDRFNKEGGGHAAGDEALKQTAIAIEQAVAEALKDKEGAQADYQIYRFDGNTFAVDLASIPLQEFGRLVSAMEQARPSVKGVKDPAPLTVRGIDFNNVVQLVNHLQAELPVEAKLDTSEEAAREIFNMLRRSADWDLEISKFAKRSERVSEKISGGDEAEARAFFENYAKKAFQDTELSTYEGFAQALKSGRFQEISDELAIRHTEKRFADGRLVEDAVQETIDARVRARGLPGKSEEAETSAPKAERPMTDGRQQLADKGKAAAAAEAAAKARPEDAALAAKAKKARLEHQIEVARRDGGTGLLDRGMYYEDLENALEEDRDVAAVFVDMGFLKYFDQMGGADVGDAALSTAAAMMERAVAEAGVEGRVYRYGGDEFTIQVEGGADAAKAVIKAIEDLAAEADPIPRTAKSRDEYAPTRLSFNCASADRVMLDELSRVAEAAAPVPEGEQADASRERNFKAELMTKAADVGIEYNKAYSRFILLIDELRNPDYAADPERKKQVDALIGFSNKALFSELGGADKLRVLAADRTLEGAALEEEVLDYVVDKVAETRARDKGQKELMDLLLAAQTKVAFLTHRLDEMKGLAGDQEHKIKRLESDLDKAKEEKRQWIQARGAIDAAA